MRRNPINRVILWTCWLTPERQEHGVPRDVRQVWILCATLVVARGVTAEER